MRRLLLPIAVAGALLAEDGKADAPAGYFIVGSGGLAGTVYAMKTRLTWQQVQPSATYPWGPAGTPGTAQNYCATLTLAGGGWRLPTAAELQSLLDYSQTGGPYIDRSTFPGTPSAGFWTASPDVNDSTRAWYVGFDYGYVGSGTRNVAIYVRCVR